MFSIFEWLANYKLQSTIGFDDVGLFYEKYISLKEH